MATVSIEWEDGTMATWFISDTDADTLEAGITELLGECDSVRC